MITRALTIHQPWAELIVWGIKKIENRGWRPRSMLGQTIAIHAGRTIDEYAVDGLVNLDWSLKPWVDSRKTVGWRTGAIIGTARISGWVESDVEILQQFDLKDGPEQLKWFVGPIGITLSEARRIPHPIECSGMNGIWPLGEQLQQQLAARMAA